MFHVEMYFQVRRACLVEGMSVREASRVFGLHRDTVRKMLVNAAPQGYRTPAEVFHGEPVEEELKERRCPDQRDLVSYEGVQESHLIVA